MSWDEERAGRALRAGLSEIEPPASRVAMERIVVDGRRGERRARLVKALGGAALAVAVGVPLAVLAVRGGGTAEIGPAERTVVSPTVNPTRPADCTVTVLTRSGPGGVVQVTDPTGAIVLGINANHLVRWRDGVSEIVASDDAGGVLMPTAVNRAGTAVGRYLTDDTAARQAGWVYRNGVLTPLARPAGARYTTPLGINEAGDIVGAMMPESLAVQSVPVVWPARSPGSPRVVQSDVSAVPVGITADGSLVGTVTGLGGREDTVAVWGSDGRRRDLPVPDGWASASVSAGVVLGDVVYGTVSRFEPTVKQPTDDPIEPQFAATPPVAPESGGSVKKMAPARWNLRDGTSRVYPVDGILAAASDGGWLLVRVGGLGNDERIVAVSPAGTAYALPPAPGTRGSNRGKWISDDGRTVIGDAVTAPGGEKPFTWTCAFR